MKHPRSDPSRSNYYAEREHSQLQEHDISVQSTDKKASAADMNSSHTAEGTDPVSLVSWSVKIASSNSPPSSFGMVPENWFPSRYISIIVVRLPNSAGSVPFIKFCASATIDNLGICPNSVGIAPVKVLLLRSRIRSSDICPSSDGNGPVNMLKSRSSRRSVAK
jgi:hypothetical protein